MSEIRDRAIADIAAIKERMAKDMTPRGPHSQEVHRNMKNLKKVVEAAKNGLPGDQLDDVLSAARDAAVPSRHS